jgi:hypothetical protein
MAEQYLSTSRLGNVIQLIALGKQTGVLKVMRGLGSTREQGEIHFTDGQPTFAVLGQLVGNAALAVLQNWGESQYVFLEAPLPPPERPAYQFDPSGRQSEPTTPSGNYRLSPVPRLPPAPGRQMGELPAFTTPLPMNPGFDLGNGRSGNTGNLSRNRGNDMRSGPLPPLSMRRDVIHGDYVPRRLASMDRLDALPLDRRERMVLLLVDGRRSLADLVRLTRRSEQELQTILSHLAALRLIE